VPDVDQLASPRLPTDARRRTLPVDGVWSASLPLIRRNCLRPEGNQIQPCRNEHNSSRNPASRRLHEEDTFLYYQL